MRCRHCSKILNNDETNGIKKDKSNTTKANDRHISVYFFVLIGVGS
jgi:phage FluMu protein Com